MIYQKIAGKINFIRFFGLLVFLTFCTAPFVSCTQADNNRTITDEEAIAKIKLYNPTKYEAAMPVEIPTGLLGSPGTIDWSNVRLVAKGNTIPFAIRAGGPHWKSKLEVPDRNVRPEDILVFSVPAETNQWSTIHIAPGQSSSESAMTEQGLEIVIEYENCKVTIDRMTGMIKDIVANGERILKAPMHLNFHTVDPQVFQYHGEFTGWPLLWQQPEIIVLRREMLPGPKVRLVSKFSSPAMTEINFEMQSGERMKMGFTYRVFPCGVVEILADERPWTGKSPWYEQAAQIKFELTGKKEELVYRNRNFPMFQFKDYAAAVPQIATIHTNQKTKVLEMGQEIVNGRSFHRRLYCLPNENEIAMNCAELADEGLVTLTEPAAKAIPKDVVIVTKDENKTPAEIIAAKLNQLGTTSTIQKPNHTISSDSTVIQLNTAIQRNVHGDGFTVQNSAIMNRIEINANTTFGFLQAAEWIGDALRVENETVQFPLIASNPWSDIRMISMECGPTEGDFVFGPEEEWKRVLSIVMKYGANRIENNGEVSNWKTPLEYKYFPELQSDSLEENDPLTGWKMGYWLEDERDKPFSDIFATRERSLRLFKYINDRGGKVDAAKHIDRCPTKFLKLYREAMKQQGHDLGAERGVCWSGPEFRKMLEAHLKELLEVYPIDGFAMQRGDAYKPCQCDDCKLYLEKSQTGTIWVEQYLLFYDLLKEQNFKGMIGLTPYHNDEDYRGKLDAMLPEDMIVFGDGCGAGMLMRDFETLVPFGETWLDSPFSAFKIPSSYRMRRTIYGHNCYYMGGSFPGLELTYASIGFFSWDPTFTPNLLRYRLGADLLGKENAIAYVHAIDEYEHLFDMMQKTLLPPEWANLSENQKRDVAADTRKTLKSLKEQLAKLKPKVSLNHHREVWFAMMDIYDAYANYHLQILELVTEMQQIAVHHKDLLLDPNGLPQEKRQAIIKAYNEMYDGHEKYIANFPNVPQGSSHKMLNHYMKNNGLTMPWKLVISGFQGSFDREMEIWQYDATVLTAGEIHVTAGKEFSIDLEVINTGCVPWSHRFAPHIRIFNVKGNNARERLKLTDFIGLGSDEPFVFADRKTVTLKGETPAEPGSARIKIVAKTPFSDGWPHGQNHMDEKTIKINWK